MTNAQVTLRIEPDMLLETDSNNLGLLLIAKPNVKASGKSTIGLRLGIAINPHKIRLDRSLPYFIDKLDDNGVISFVPTYDYDFNNKYYNDSSGDYLTYYYHNRIEKISIDELDIGIGKLNYLLRIYRKRSQKS